MKLIISGKHKRNVALAENSLVDCVVVIEYGELQRVKFDNIELTNGYLLKSKTDYSLKRYSKHGVSHYPIGYNYSLIYNSEHGEEIVFLKLNWFKFWQMKFAMRKTLLQSKDIKVEVVKYIVIGVLGLFGLKQCKSVYQYIRYPNPQPIAKDSTERKTSSKMKDSVPLTDSLRVE